jgi:hypothetical protein
MLRGRGSAPIPNYLSEKEMDAISAHVEAQFGPIDGVLHEVASDALHIDVNVVKPNAKSSRNVLVTMGMSALPMRVPKGYPGPAFTELFMVLPARWPLTEAAFEKHGEDLYWPIGWLKRLARLPNDFQTFLCPGHTIPNGDPPERLSPRCGFVGFAIVPAPEGIDDLMTVGKREVSLFMVVPLLPDEMQLKLDEGIDALLDAMEQSETDLLDLADPKRPSVVKRR